MKPISTARAALSGGCVAPVFDSGAGAAATPPAWPHVRGPGGAAPEVRHRTAFGARLRATPAVVGDRLDLRTAAHIRSF